MVKLVLTLALLTFIPLMWAVYGAVGYLVCWLCHGLHILGIQIFNGIFIWPEQMTASFINGAAHISLPVWAFAPTPSLTDWSPHSGWVIALSVITYLVFAGKAIQEYKDDWYNW